MINIIGNIIGVNISTALGVDNWILATGLWSDYGLWDDSAMWID